MKLNNLELIIPFLNFRNPGDYYFLQILKRRKENPDLGKDMVHLRDYYIFSVDDLTRRIPEIEDLCNRENARAYFRMNVRNSKKTSLETLRRLADLIASGNYDAGWRAWASCSGEFHSDPDKKWIVDVDWKDLDRKSDLSQILTLVENLQSEAGRIPMVELIPTLNGTHIICRPFNLKKFRDVFPNVDVHKDNPTILYASYSNESKI